MPDLAVGTSRALAGQVALVTGASRGIGRGIAQALGEAGATVYVTGRSMDAASTTVPLPGTVRETAELVTAAGGYGIAVECDHSDDEQTEAVFDLIDRNHGQLDLLVNNAWAGYQAKQRNRRSGFRTPFWKLPPSFWDTMNDVGVRSAYVASMHAARRMVPRRRGLIVLLSVMLNGPADNVAYGAAKSAVNRMALDMSSELREHDVAVVSLCPGMVATEMLMARRKSQRLLPWMETPFGVGQAVVTLATDPHTLRMSGQVIRTKQLAAEPSSVDTEDVAAIQQIDEAAEPLGETAG